ncbi:MAG: antitoxin Xre/MbcA/ParS toxin-binding domain-containing protein [Anaeromyxobacteraceae bacterium]
MLTDDEIRATLDRVSGSMALEGMPLTEDDRAIIALQLRGDLTEEQFLQIVWAQAKGSPVLGRAQRALGTLRVALDWLRTPNVALEGRTPLELLGTDEGAEQVIQVLGGIGPGSHVRIAQDRPNPGDNESHRLELAVTEQSTRSGTQSPFSGQRFTDKAALVAAVRRQCALEFQRRWPAVPVHEVAARVNAVIDASARSANAYSMATALHDQINACLNLARNSVSDPQPSAAFRLNECVPELRALDEKLSALWRFTAVNSHEGPAAIGYPNLYGELGVIPFCRNLAVLLAFSDRRDPPSARELAVACLLADDPIDTPTGEGTTVAEVIAKKRRAMAQTLCEYRWAI